MNQKQIQTIVELLNLSQNQVKNTIKLLAEGATVPFIARYRKEITESLDEIQILDIKKLFEKLEDADKRRLAIKKAIEEQGKLSKELEQKLDNALFINEMEDLYLPFKLKRKTKATIAIENGLEPLAKVIFMQNERNISLLAANYLNNKIKTISEALSGAREIIAEWINEDIEARNKIRMIFEKDAIVYSKIKKDKESEGIKYKDYFDYSEALKTIPSHRYLAIKRGEEEGFLKVSIDIDLAYAQNLIERFFLKGLPEAKEQMSLAITDAIKRLLYPSIEKEYDNKAKEKG